MVRLGKNNPRNSNKTFAVNSNVIASLYGPKLTENCSKLAEEYASHVVDNDLEDVHEVVFQENERVIKTVYKDQRMLNELQDFLKVLSKEYSSGNDWRAKANATKLERLLDERYGRLRPLFTHPKVARYVKVLQKKHALGHFSPIRQKKSPLNLTSSIVLLFMLHRNRVRTDAIVLVALFLIVGLQPWALVCCVALWRQYIEGRRKKRPVGYKPLSVEPYYKRGSSKEEKHQCLLEPVRSKNQEIEEQQVFYDAILLGSGPDTLYCAALLSKIGRRVLVLSPDTDASGCLTIDSDNDPKWASTPFDVSDSKVGRIHRQQEILAPALCNDVDCQGGVRFSPIGTPADGFTYDIISVPGMGLEDGDLSQHIPYALRAGGVAALWEDASEFLGDSPWNIEDSSVASYMNTCDTLNGDAFKFYFSKLLPHWSSQNQASEYGGASRIVANEFLKKIIPNSTHLRSFVAAIGMRSEDIVPRRASMGAHISNISQACDPAGFHYPVGGPRALCHAFRATIEAAGGKIVTGAKVKTLLFDDGPKDDDAGGVNAETLNAQSSTATKKPLPVAAPRCIGVELEDKRAIHTYEDGAIISSLGFLPTFYRYIPEDVRAKGGIPEGLAAVSERRPQMQILLALKGDASQLELPAADWWRLPHCALATDGVDTLSGEIKPGDVGAAFEQQNDVVTEEESKEGTEPISKSASSSSRPKKFDSSKSWIRISFPSAKDPSWKERHPGISTCVVTVEADDEFVKAIDTAPRVYSIQNFGSGEQLRLLEKVLKDVYEMYPQLEGKILTKEIHGPVRMGISHTPHKYAAKGIRPETPYPGLYMSGVDLTVDGFSGSTVGGWLAANAAVGYDVIDLVLAQKDITSDLRLFMKAPKQSDEAVPFMKNSIVHEEEKIGVDDDAK